MWAANIARAREGLQAATPGGAAIARSMRASGSSAGPGATVAPVWQAPRRAKGEAAGAVARCRFPPPRRVVMEARGIEPRSENDSDTTTTCVGEASAVSPPWRLAGPGSEQPLPALTRPVRAPDHASPILRYVSAASGGLPLTQVREAEAYAASARFELAVINVPVV